MPDALYMERYRPRFHFTAQTGWLNDPNGLVFYDGEYHLFFQHNPTGTMWGNMTWGHAVSTDLVHWRQLRNAIEPYDAGTIFSGSAVVDRANTSSLGNGDPGPVVALFTHARKPFGQALAVSHDRCRSWALYDGGRHVVPNQGMDPGERDPRVFRHEPSGRWVMVLWVKRGVARIFTSEDLKRWEFASDFAAPDFYECPDLFELPVPGRKGETRWILHDAAFNYWVGEFDGLRFSPEAGPIRGDYGQNFYAAQTWNDLPNRKVQIAWMCRGVYPEMPFNQQMSFPCELTLRETSEGLRLARNPVAERAGLREKLVFQDSLTLQPGTRPFGELEGDAFEIRVVADAAACDRMVLTAYRRDIVYTPANGTLSTPAATAPLKPRDGLIEIHALVDRTSLEVFANQGSVSISSCFVADSEAANPGIHAEGGRAVIRELSVYRLRSAWSSAV